MSRIVTFLVPDNQILFAALGRMAIRHSHLDYVLRMSIKTLTGKTVTEGLAVTKLTQNWRLRRQIDDVATSGLASRLLCFTSYDNCWNARALQRPGAMKCSTSYGLKSLMEANS